MQMTKTFYIPLATMLLALLVCSLLEAQNKKEKPKPKKKNPAMEKVVDDPNLPRVLLIGDSISIGYTVAVRDLLKGKANVHRPLTNCGPTSKGVAEIDAWLGEKKWDVIHFNWGLHDLKYMGSKGQNLADPNAKDSHPQIPIDQYKANMTKLVARLKQTGATLIWRSTTPVPEGAKGRVVGDSAKYNAVAASIMKENSIAIDDMFTYSRKMEGIQLPKNVHYSKEGSEQLAKKVVESIQAKLDDLKKKK